MCHKGTCQKENKQCCMDFMVDYQVRKSWVKEQAINRYAILLNLCTMGFSLLVLQFMYVCTDKGTCMYVATPN